MLYGAHLSHDVPSQMYYVLTRAIGSAYEKHRQGLDEYRKKMNIRQKLYDLFTHNRDFLKAHSFDLYVVGSTQSQFSIKSSDLDLCLVIYDQNGQLVQQYLDHNELAIGILEKVQDLISKNDLYEKGKLYRNAVVPIYRFTAENDISIDLSINRTATLKSTCLLTNYNFIDSRVAPLVVAVKCWARNLAINSAFQGTLSSYSLTLMTLHFLQAKHGLPVLYSLHPQWPFCFGFSILPNWRPNQHCSVGHLFIDFIRYYCDSATFEHTISICANNSPFDAKEGPIMVEDPFEKKNTARSAYNFARVQRAFNSTWQSIISGDCSVDNFFA